MSVGHVLATSKAGREGASLERSLLDTIGIVTGGGGAVDLGMIGEVCVSEVVDGIGGMLTLE